MTRNESWLWWELAKTAFEPDRPSQRLSIHFSIVRVLHYSIRYLTGVKIFDRQCLMRNFVGAAVAWTSRPHRSAIAYARRFSFNQLFQSTVHDGDRWRNVKRWSGWSSTTDVKKRRVSMADRSINRFNFRFIFHNQNIWTYVGVSEWVEFYVPLIGHIGDAQ